MTTGSSSGGEGINITVTGAHRLEGLAKRLKEAGDRGLKLELTRSLRLAARPLTEAARQGALDTLPHKHGLASEVAGGRFAVQIRTSGKTVGVRFVANSHHDVRAMNRGILRHPVWGHRDRWVTQRIRPHWFDVPVERAAQQVRPLLLEAMDRVAKQITE